MSSPEDKQELIGEITTEPPKNGAFALIKEFHTKNTNPRSLETYITELPAILGRPNRKSEMLSNFYSIGGEKAKGVSRKHFVLDYDRIRGQYSLENLGKNGFKHNNTEVRATDEKGEPSKVYLKNYDRIGCGIKTAPTRFVFLQAQFQKPDASLADLAREAFESHSVLPAKLVCAFMMKGHEFYLAKYGNPTLFPDFEAEMTSVLASSHYFQPVSNGSELFWKLAEN